MKWLTRRHSSWFPRSPPQSPKRTSSSCPGEGLLASHEGTPVLPTSRFPAPCMCGRAQMGSCLYYPLQFPSIAAPLCFIIWSISHCSASLVIANVQHHSRIYSQYSSERRALITWLRLSGCTPFVTTRCCRYPVGVIQHPDACPLTDATGLVLLRLLRTPAMLNQRLVHKIASLCKGAETRYCGWKPALTV